MSNPINEMSHFIIGVSNDLLDEFLSAMMHDNINISRLMVHTQQVEKSRLTRKNREAMRAKSF